MKEHLILYDGECGLCQFSVQWLLDHDKDGLLFFTALQGETAKPYLESGRLPKDLDSLVYVRGEREIFWYSTGILEIVRTLPAPWSWFYITRFCPRFLRDGVYKMIAANRIRIFGPADACRLPTPEEMSRFLP